MAKKIISVVVAVLMLCAMFAIGAFAADVKPGESAQVTVSISGNPGISYLKIRLSYDSSVLTLKAAEDTGFLKGYTPAESLSLNPYPTAWSYITNTNDDGDILTLTFEISSEAPDGTYPISVEVVGASNQKEEPVTVNVSTSSVTVKHEHKWDAGTVTKEATCKEAGEKTFTCSVCKGTKTEIIKKLENHTWDAGKVTKTATCKEAGEKTLTCTVCKETKKETIPVDKNNHADYGTEVKGKKDATETAKGYTGDTVCKGCGAVLKKGEDIPALGHKHTLTKTEAKAATCTAAGNVEYYTCSGCKKTFSDAAGTKEIANVTVPAKGHSFGEWKVEKEATKTATGLKSRVCTVCNQKETQVIPKLTEPTSRIILDDGAGKSFVDGKDGKDCKPTEKAKDDGKCSTEKADANAKPAKTGAKTVKTDSGKNTGDNGIIMIVTGLVAMAGAALVVSKKRKHS